MKNQRFSLSVQNSLQSVLVLNQFRDIRGELHAVLFVPLLDAQMALGRIALYTVSAPGEGFQTEVALAFVRNPLEVLRP